MIDSILARIYHIKKYSDEPVLVLRGDEVETVKRALETVSRYEKQTIEDMGNVFEPIKISSALNSELMKLEVRKQTNPKSISPLDYTIIACLHKVLEEVSE